ncbi:MAG TPA: FAD-dependent monooxygenase [Casimicrobiaceae bacterium]|nr:FAD-dependent monooxygenase [Casimicrobiaceae bacterium]
MPDVDVLIAGAGPTGLVLALWLARSGVRIRIVDKVPEPGTTSRALVVHARTLEFYRQLGIADSVVAAAVRFTTLNLWVGGQHVARVDLGPLGEGITAFPFLLIFPQDEHERLLIDKLREAGASVERPCELRGFEDRGDRIAAQLRHGDGRDETCEAAFLAGCDGAHSTVRETLAAGFPGGTYSHLFYVADVTATGPVMNGELNVALDAADLLAVFPMKGNSSVRLVGTIDRQNAQHGQGAPHAQWSDIGHDVIDRLRIDVTRVNWFSTYRVHHRVAGHFRFGRTFLLGDAAHIHSPVGGQGMNTGIGDAVNLAWKLACVIRNGASERLLDTYEPERIAFARRLVASTDRAFQLASSDGPVARFVRLRVIPRLLPSLFTHRAVRRFMFRTVSQTAIEYRHSVLSSGAAGRVQAGDRLPWVEAAAPGEDNHAALSARDWQMHVYGDAERAVVEACRQRTLALHAFAWRDSMRDAGFERDAMYLIRPDGYVAFAQARPDVTALLRYLGDWKIASRHR